MVETTMPADTNVSPETERQQQSTSSKEPAPVPAHESQSESQSQSQTQTQPQPEQQPEPLKPGPRASRLHQVYSKALQATLRANSYANFSACFPTPAQHASRSLESVWRQLNTKLEQSAQAEFDDILKERDVVRGLNELDRLIADAKVRRDVEGAGGSRVP
ncbi:hypothetical protein KEM54_002608 [Ascosphaera aggregata]|nr:hypothetical protein KEM54_002608 [Ascosphaera aggregata]